MTDLDIRPATRADLPGVLALYAQPDYDDGDVLSLPEAEAQLARMAGYPAYTLYVAVDAMGTVAGTFALLIMDRLGHRGTPSAVVDDVAVDPTRQGQGIGRRMMQAAMDRARDAGCYKLMLSSNLKRTDAHAFYDRLGFERHGYSYVVRLD
jgi:GNAT superfamily N-acetyltransferase